MARNEETAHCAWNESNERKIPADVKGGMETARK